MSAQEEFEMLDEKDKANHMGIESRKSINSIIDYIYEHFDEFKLIICKSEGTCYENFVHNMVEIEVAETFEFIKILKKQGYDIPDMEKEVCHMIASATETYLAHQLPDMVGSMVTPIGLLMFLFAFDWRFGLISLIPIVLSFVIMMVFMTEKTLQTKMEENQNALDDVSLEIRPNQTVAFVGPSGGKTMLANNLKGKTLFYVIGAVVCLIVVFTITLWQYNSTFLATYVETGTRRITLAEKLRKIPLSFFSKKDLADLTSTIMADCTYLETAFSHFIPPFAGSMISTVIIAISLLFFNVKMAVIFPAVSVKEFL